MQAVFSNPAEWLGAKVYVEGVVTRTMGTNAYIQDTFEQEDGTVKSYGADSPCTKENKGTTSFKVGFASVSLNNKCGVWIEANEPLKKKSMLNTVSKF